MKNHPALLNTGGSTRKNPPAGEILGGKNREGRILEKKQQLLHHRGYSRE
jgi:hypothetical protein